MDESALYNQAGKRHPDLEDSQPLDLMEIFQRPPPRLDFVLPGLLSSTVGALVSSDGTDASMLALQIAATIAGGCDTLDLAGMDRKWKRVNGRVVFLSAEDLPDELDKRFHALAKHLNEEERETVFKNLALGSFYGRDVDLMASGWRDWFSEVTSGARLVILDRLRRFHYLDEDEDRQMMQLIDYMGQLCMDNATTVLFLQRANITSRLDLRFLDYTRFEANLDHMTVAQAKKHGLNSTREAGLVRLSFPKINYAPPIADKWFKCREEGVFEPVIRKDELC